MLSSTHQYALDAMLKSDSWTVVKSFSSQNGFLEKNRVLLQSSCHYYTSDESCMLSLTPDMSMEWSNSKLWEAAERMNT